eukprot:g8261.t1
MSRSTAAASTSAGVVLGVLIFTAWRLWYTKKRGRRLSVRYLLDASDECNGKVLDLRQEDSFEKARVRGSHNIPVASLWGDNRWYELPEQHEPLIVLIPEDGAPDRGMTCDSLAKEIKSRRAEGATATLVFDESLLDAARETGLLLEGGGVAEESERPVSPSDGPGDRESPTPSRTLFTPSPFLTRAAPAIEPHLRHAWLPLTCIDIGCGAGRDAVWLARRGWKVTAMDCWDQVLQKAARLSRTYGVADRVEVVRGKVKNTGEIHLSVQPEGAKQDPAPSAVDGPDAPEDAGGLAGASESGEQVAAGAVPVGEQRIITPLTPASGYGAFTLVVAIRFLERSAFDTLARLVDPRGGYILLSTFIEEERETMAENGGKITMLGPIAGKVCAARQQRLQPQGSPLATPASSFGPVPDAALFLQKSPLEPTPEAPAPGTGNTSADSTAPDGKSSSPANGFPLHSSTFSEDSSSGHDGDGDVFGGAAGDVRSGGRAAMWGGVSGATSGSVRDFTASRAASSSRRLAERRQSGLGFAHYGGDQGEFLSVTNAAAPAASSSSSVALPCRDAQRLTSVVLAQPRRAPKMDTTSKGAIFSRRSSARLPMPR